MISDYIVNCCFVFLMIFYLNIVLMLGHVIQSVYDNTLLLGCFAKYVLVNLDNVFIQELDIQSNTCYI